MQEKEDGHVIMWHEGSLVAVSYIPSSMVVDFKV